MTHFSDSQARASANRGHALPVVPAAPSAPAPRGGRDPRPAAPASPLEVALAAIGDGYKAHLVWQLFWGARPFCHLMRRIPGISRKALRSRLGEMERAGLVTRRDVGDGIRRAQYGLTPLGETLKPIVGGMYEWGLWSRNRRPWSSARATERLLLRPAPERLRALALEEADPGA